ncbi:MAG: hypothetical protein M0R66_01130 [Candidatus Omnitrophica bacterium]|nr:hypothetical protein [Candidatus Omnitrophota bacterium]
MVEVESKSPQTSEPKCSKNNDVSKEDLEYFRCAACADKNKPCSGCRDELRAFITARDWRNAYLNERSAFELEVSARKKAEARLSQAHGWMSKNQLAKLEEFEKITKERDGLQARITALTSDEAIVRVWRTVIPDLAFNGLSEEQKQKGIRAIRKALSGGE